MMPSRARSVSRLTHPNIVPLFEADVQDQQPYLVFGYVPGQTLAVRGVGFWHCRANAGVLWHHNHGPDQRHTGLCVAWGGRNLPQRHASAQVHGQFGKREHQKCHQFYADKAEKGGTVIDEKELALLRTLRNQAVMAFKQSAQKEGDGRPPCEINTDPVRGSRSRCSC